MPPPKPSPERRIITDTEARAILVEAIAPLEKAAPGTPEAILYGRLNGAKKGDNVVTAFAAIHQIFRPDDGTVGTGSGPLAEPDVTLVDVLVRAVRFVDRVKEREKAEKEAREIIDAAAAAIRPLRKFEALLVKEAPRALDPAHRLDYDLEPPAMWDVSGLRLALATIKGVIEDRRDVSIVRREHLRLTQVRAREGNINYAVLAALSDLVASLAITAPKARQTHIAKLAEAIFAETQIAPETVKAARKRLLSGKR